MRIRVLKAPGGRGMEAERISALLRKKVKSIGRSDQPHPELEIEGGKPKDIRTLLKGGYELLEWKEKEKAWVNPRTPPK